VDGTKPTATKGAIAACYPDAASANAAALAATTGLTDNCGATGVTKAVQTGAGTCDTAIVIRVQDSCGNYTDYTYTRGWTGPSRQQTKGTIAACYPDAASANQAGAGCDDRLERQLRCHGRDQDSADRRGHVRHVDYDSSAGFLRQLH